MATGLLPFLQYRHCFSPALGPVTFSGWNGPASSSPHCGPDFTASPASTAPATSANRATKPRAIRSFIMDNLLVVKRTWKFLWRQVNKLAVCFPEIRKESPEGQKFNGRMDRTRRRVLRGHSGKAWSQKGKYGQNADRSE